jgi:thermostable 8-oxoguanine DNA glycosylase
MGRGYPERGIAGRRYLEVEEAYQRAAAVAGVSPREFQAAIWVHTRGSDQ